MSNNDPLARFRRKEPERETELGLPPLTERQALKLAISALNDIPNARMRLEGYENTYKLIPDLEKAYRAGEQKEGLEGLAPRMYQALLLCEDVLSHSARLDDGTPSVSTLIDIRAIKKEAGYPTEAQVIGMMEGVPGAPAVGHYPAPQEQQSMETAQLKDINTKLIAVLQGAIEQMEQCESMFRDDKEFMGALTEARDTLAKVMPEHQLGQEVITPRLEREINIEPNV